MSCYRIAAFGIVAAIMASVFSGCSRDGESTVSPSNTTVSDTSQTEVTVKPEYAAKYTLSNENADEITHRVYDLICDNYGTYMFSCQQESTWMGSPDYEMDYILETTGRLPAMRGLDFMNSDFDGVVERSKAWWDKGGLVTICWHTGINGYGYQESKDDVPDFDKLLTEGTPEHEAMIANWDKAAAALAELRDSGVPVLWRPFHEFDGGWFWWGKGGGENFIRLWQMMYERYTNEFGLTNLIWVLGYSGEVKDGWYPGDDYCDIIGSDTYDNSTHVKAWNKLQNITDSGKPLTFHECGKVPRVEMFERDGCLWSWFMIWHTDYIKGNNKKVLNNVYNHEKVITLDELPDLASYRAGDKITQIAASEMGSEQEEISMQQYEKIMTELPPEGIFDRQDGVIYPDFQKYTYYSQTAERESRVNVLLPPDYSEDKEYPVLYVLHGYYDNEDWMARDIVGLSEMLSNLYASGEAQEMIVVCPYIFVSKELEWCNGMNLENSLCYDNFINDLTTDLMPFIESTFSVAKGRENTAITGFSMGGRESLFIGFQRPELFGYIGAVAPAPGLTPVPGSADHPGQMQAEEMRFKDNAPYLLLISCSDSDGVVGTYPKSYHKALTINETEHIWNEIPGTGHDHTSVKPHLYNFCRMIFNN